VASANLEHASPAAGGTESRELAAPINRLGDAYRGQHGDMEATASPSRTRAWRRSATGSPR
jgi:hypothetical protein